MKKNKNTFFMIDVIFNETNLNPILHIEAPKNTNRTFVPRETDIVLQPYILIQEDHKEKTK